MVTDGDNSHEMFSDRTLKIGGDSHHHIQKWWQPATTVTYIVAPVYVQVLQCFDSTGWATGRASTTHHYHLSTAVFLRETGLPVSSWFLPPRVSKEKLLE